MVKSDLHGFDAQSYCQIFKYIHIFKYHLQTNGCIWWAALVVKYSKYSSIIKSQIFNNKQMDGFDAKQLLSNIPNIQVL